MLDLGISKTRNIRRQSSNKRVAPRKMIYVVYSLIVLLGIGVVVFLYRWQVVMYAKFKALAMNVTNNIEVLSSHRGSIYTSDGTVVAMDKLSTRLYVSVVYPKDMDALREKIPQLFEYLVNNKIMTKKQADEYIKKIQNAETLPYFILVDDVPDYQVDSIKNLIKDKRISGVYIKQYYKRIYPLETNMASVLGFVSKNPDSLKGLYGVEGYFWSDIKGREGKVVKQATKQGNLVISGQYKLLQAKEGKNIVLTINLAIQQKVEKWLKQGVEKYKAKAGAVIVMNPKTGEILAMASYPTYDPNKYWQIKDYDTYQNKAVSYVYEYGSVQKPLTIAIALQEKKIKKDYKCYDNGVLKVLDRKIYNWEYKRYGLLDLSHILRYSDNVCSGTIALKLTPKIFYDYLTRLGLGSLTNIGLLEEETGYLKPYDKWNKVDLAVTGFGQMVTATPLQVITAHSTLANDGVRMHPLLIKKVFDNDSSIEFSPTVADTIFSKDVAQYVRKIMYQASSGVGYLGVLGKKYKIAGKTGTAQIAKQDGVGYEEDEVNSTFVGFAPYDDPQVIMLVMLIRPEKKKLASYTVVPMWRDIFNDIKDDLRLVPSY